MASIVDRAGRRRNNDIGFTLIELLVVVVIIGVLIAIAIPLYLNYRKGAENKSAASDLRGAISTLEQCYTDNSNVYPSAVTGAGAMTGCSTGAIKLSSGTTITYFPDVTTNTANYLIYTTHGSNGVFYCYASAAGGSVQTKSAAGTAYAATC
ncbi:MAG: prepilin-type N-terminal cleavage/methylation domain-containing protein [Actinobacteria bacterium]|nr:prepilin-type N-terminal cleavage/methylation domain-containing protein [Actinomycetota bacterium]